MLYSRGFSIKGASNTVIRAGVGLSTAASTARAASESAERAVAALDGAPPTLCIVFATADHAGDIRAGIDIIATVAKTPHVVGCSAAGVIGEGREVEDGPAIGVLAVASDAVRATPFLFDGAGDCGLTAGIRLGQRMMASKDTRDLILAWPDPFRVHPGRMLDGLDATLGRVPVAGGAASAGAGAETFQFSGAEVAAGAVSGVRLGGAFRHRIAVSQGCRPVGGPLRVTRAHENLVLELDGRPAIDRLREIVPEDMFEDPERAQDVVSVALLPEPGDATLRAGEFLVRNIVAADPDTGVLGLADDVEEGQFLVIAIREPRAARDDLSRALSDLSAAGTALDYRFGLYFDCLARGRSLYKRDGVDTSMLAKTFPGLPILGFFCNAEIAPLRGANRLFTYTGVLVMVAE